MVISDNFLRFTIYDQMRRCNPGDKDVPTLKVLLIPSDRFCVCVLMSHHGRRQSTVHRSVVVDISLYFSDFGIFLTLYGLPFPTRDVLK